MIFQCDAIINEPARPFHRAVLNQVSIHVICLFFITRCWFSSKLTYGVQINCMVYIYRNMWRFCSSWFNQTFAYKHYQILFKDLFTCTYAFNLRINYCKKYIDGHKFSSVLFVTAINIPVLQDYQVSYHGYLYKAHPEIQKGGGTGGSRDFEKGRYQPGFLRKKDVKTFVYHFLLI